MAKTIAMVLGWAFLLVGVLGFFPNPLVGEEGLFHTDLNHNIVHLLSGAILLWAAYAAPAKAASVLKVLGIVYLVVTILGFVVGDGMLLGLLEINSADNILHLVLTAALLYGGFAASNGRAFPRDNASI